MPTTISLDVGPAGTEVTINGKPCIGVIDQFDKLMKDAKLTEKEGLVLMAHYLGTIIAGMDHLDGDSHNIEFFTTALAQVYANARGANLLGTLATPPKQELN